MWIERGDVMTSTSAMSPGDAPEATAVPIRTFLVEDEPMASLDHQRYVDRLDGFQVCGSASTGREATRLLARERIDLLLLDIRLPDISGLELLRRIRASGSLVDVIVMSSDRDAGSIRAALSQGAVQYVVKPFLFATLREKLLAYQAFRLEVQGMDDVEQNELDRALALLHTTGPAPLPRGMNSQTLDLVVQSLACAGEASAGEIAGQLGISRITARRYLTHLVEAGRARNGHRYGQVGRPELRFRLTAGS